jgi:putative ABC transport system permease protein
MSLWSRIANALRGDRLNREIDEELQSHIDEAIQQGRDIAEARQAFGSTLRPLDRSHDIRVLPWLDSLRADAVFGWRQLKKNKVTSAAAILSLALAIGSCTAAFRLIDALLLRPLPVARPDRLFFLTYPYLDAAGQTQTDDSFDYPQFRTLRAALKQDAELIAISRPGRNGLTFGSDDEMEKFWRQSVSGWMFASFGLKPALGRLLNADDDLKPGAHPVAVLSYDYWARRFARDPAVVGLKFRMGADVYQIVGVCENGFTGTEPGTVTDIFLPTMMNTQAIENAHWSWFRIWVRLQPGVALEPLREKLRAAVSAYRQERVKAWPPGTSRERIAEFIKAVVSLEPALAGASGLQREYRRSLAVLGVVVALVLLIACANVANLMMAQAAARSREMALRVSIGADRWRLVQLVIVESVLIALCASALGGMFAWWSAPSVVSRINPPDNPARLILPADWRVLAFAAALALAVTWLFGLMPALRASAVKPMSALRGGEPHSRRRLMNVLVAAQVAFCFLVLFVTGLFVATFDRLAHQPTGFVADRLLTLETVTRNNQPSLYWDQVRQRLQSVRGVESIAICGWALMTGNGWSDAVWVNGRPPDNEEAYFLAVSPGWLETMRIPLIDGRDFRPQDAFPGTVIVNQAFARRYFEGRNPVGESFETIVEKKRLRSQIVGYARDARYLNMREAIRPTIYVPFDTKSKGADWATFVVRTTAPDPMALSSILRRELPRARPEFRVVSFRTQTELVEQHSVRERLLAMLSVFFGIVALVLAGVGLYGVLTYSVLERRREIGIRIALGAPPAAVATRLTASVFSMLLVGAAVGLIAGLASQHYLENLLYQVKPTDPAMLALPSLTIIAAAFLAALPATIRAVRIDPAATLRSE